MRTIAGCRWAVAAAAIAFIFGCAHRGPDPFVTGPEEIERERATPPECFTAPLTDCVADPTEGDPGDRLASPWREDFEPDLAARLCRGDHHARQRWLDGARRLRGDDPRESVYLELLGHCSTVEYCGWAMEVAATESESRPARRALLENARRWCAETVGLDALERVAAGLGVSVAGQAPWITDSQQERCAEYPRLDDPWKDLIGLQTAGCLDLGEWIESHREAADATAAALERCVNGSEIRYQEASCLRELAGLDRSRAVALVRADDRRGWGISSTIARYAGILNRFPEDGGLEAELGGLGLLPAGPSPPVVPGDTPVLPQEILGHRGRALFFNPGCPVRYCEHAPMAYQLVALVSPALDDVILEERWPALEAVDLGSGPRPVSTSVGGVPVTLQVVEGEDGGFDRVDHDRLRDAVAAAREQPHLLTAYSGGRAYRMRLRNLDEWYDLGTLLAGLNTLLADRGSDLRFVTLDPHCMPCAIVVAGPWNGLIDAAFDGLIEVTDPFMELWAEPGFVVAPAP